MSGYFPNTVDVGDSSDSTRLGVEHYWVDRVVVVSVNGELNTLTAPRLTAAVSEGLAGSPVGMIIDLSQVEFLASAGLSVLLATHEKVTPNVRFRVVADSVAVLRPITVLFLDEVITVYPTMADALRDPRAGLSL